jgi:hemerythrin-like domain-containing protein
MHEPPVVCRIRQEHRQFAAALRDLRKARVSDAVGMRSLLRVDGWARQGHQAIEERLLFPLLARRCPAFAPVLRRLQAEHRQIERARDDLRLTLAAQERTGAEPREAFTLLLLAYADLSLGHIEVEENYVLPVALDHLSPADWQRLQQEQAEIVGAGHAGVQRRPPQGD